MEAEHGFCLRDLLGIALKWHWDLGVGPRTLLLLLGLGPALLLRGHPLRHTSRISTSHPRDRNALTAFN
eukprot:6172581-Pleurochrysis_carterae.AAC.2